MILVDTSVWVQHLRERSLKLSRVLEKNEVLTHPFVIGELACGSLRNRKQILDLLSSLPQVPVADHDETLRVIETRRLYSSGIGWIDAHLLASALLMKVSLWTMDRRLASIASALGLTER